MTFVPFGKLDQLNAMFADRSATSAVIAGSSTTTATARPLTLTTRFELFACKKVSRAAHGAPAPSATIASVPAFDEDEDEQALLAAPKWTAANANAQSSNATTLSAAPSEVERLVPLVVAVMDAMYERDGFSFDGVLDPSHVCPMPASEWFDAVCSCSCRTASAATISAASLHHHHHGGHHHHHQSYGSSLGYHGGGGAGGGGGGSMGQRSAVEAQLDTMDPAVMWRILADALAGNTDDVLPMGMGMRSGAGGSISQLVVDSNGGVAPSSFAEGSANSEQQEHGSVTSSNNHDHNHNHTTSAVHPSSSSSSSSSSHLPLTSQQLQFFRFNAPDLDPQRKLGGPSIRSAVGTPSVSTVATPVVAGTPNFGGAATSASSTTTTGGGGGGGAGAGSMAQHSSLPFPSTPPVKMFGTRRERDDSSHYNVAGAAAAAAGGSSSSTVATGVPEGLQSPQNTGPRPMATFLSEHFFAFNKKTKMVLAVVACGR